MTTRFGCEAGFRQFALTASCHRASVKTRSLREGPEVFWGFLLSSLASRLRLRKDVAPASRRFPIRLGLRGDTGTRRESEGKEIPDLRSLTPGLHALYG